MHIHCFWYVLCMINYPRKIICKATRSQKDNAFSIVSKYTQLHVVSGALPFEHMGVSWNRGTRKIQWKWMIWGYPIFQDPHITKRSKQRKKHHSNCGRTQDGPKACWWHRGPKFENCLCRPGGIVRIGGMIPFFRDFWSTFPRKIHHETYLCYLVLIFIWYENTCGYHDGSYEHCGTLWSWCNKFPFPSISLIWLLTPLMLNALVKYINRFKGSKSSIARYTSYCLAMRTHWFTICRWAMDTIHPDMWGWAVSGVWGKIMCEVSSPGERRARKKAKRPSQCDKPEQHSDLC